MNCIEKKNVLFWRRKLILFIDVFKTNSSHPQAQQNWPKSRDNILNMKNMSTWFDLWANAFLIQILIWKLYSLSMDLNGLEDLLQNRLVCSSRWFSFNIFVCNYMHSKTICIFMYTSEDSTIFILQVIETWSDTHFMCFPSTYVFSCMEEASFLFQIRWQFNWFDQHWLLSV